MNPRLAELLAEILGLELAEIEPKLSKSDVGNWDSLRQMDLVVSLENEFEIRLEITDIVRMTSVAEIIEVLIEKGVDIGG